MGRFWGVMVISPQWSKLGVGDEIDVVVKSVALELPNDQNLVRTMDHTSQWIVISGKMGVSADQYMCLGLVVKELGPRLVVGVSDSSIIRPLPPPGAASFSQVIELCCGIGAWSSSCADTGLTILAGVDQNGRWGQLFRELHPGAHFLTGDIASRQVLCDLVDLGAARALTLAGVSCQPHSRAGDRRGMQDSRAVSLPKAILTGWLLQSPVIMLECVAEIEQNKEVQDLLKAACQEGGYHMCQKVLRLQDIWCARRERWFCVLSALPIGPVRLDDLPSSPLHSTVQQVMPYVIEWPRHEMEQLSLGLYELCKFYDFASGGIDNLYLKMDAVLPTSLHSIGNQCYPCACGCRPALSLERMSSQGLFGVLVPMDEHFVHENRQRRSCRYPHPKELYLLNGGLPTVNFLDNMRLALAGIGQCVSPIQGLWTLAQVRKQVDEFLQLPVCDPVGLLEAYLVKLAVARDSLWPLVEPIPAPVAAQAQHQVVVCWEDTCDGIECVVDPRAPVDFLVRAEAALRHLSAEIIQVRDYQGKVVDLQCALGLCTTLFLSVPSPASSHAELNADRCLTCPCMEWEVEAVSPTLPFDVEMPQEDSPDSRDSSGSVFNLVSLQQPQLLNVTCPNFDAGDRVHVFLDCFLTQDTRRQVLENQQGAWGDDEIRRCLARISRDAPKASNVVMWEPLLLTSISLFGDSTHFQPFIGHLHQHATIVSAVLVERHWLPVLWKCDPQGATLITCHGAEHPSLVKLHRDFCSARQCTCHPVQWVQPPFPVANHCGAMVVSFLENQIWGTPVPSTPQELGLYHEHLRQSFIRAMQPQCQRPWIWGLGDSSWKTKLEMLLQEHGVAANNASARAKVVVDKLGESAVIKAIGSSQPWKDLKWHANTLVPPFQLIRPAELQESIARRVASGEDVGRKTQKKVRAKGSGKGKSVPQVLAAQGLRVGSGMFQGGNDIPLSQLSLQQMTPECSGVILVNTNEATPYLKSGKQISVGALGLILVDSVITQIQTPLIAEKVRFPVMCLANAEPLIIEGALFQLGAIPVRRATVAAQCTLVALDSCVTKVMVYRDMVDISWDRFREFPLKFILAKLPVFRPCEDPSCTGDCEFWHSGEKCTLDDPVMEVWHRQWITHAFTVVPPERADCFTLHMRLPSCLQTRVQHYSGNSGLFLEPRQIDGKGPSECFQVIWIPKSTMAELQHLKQTTAGIVGIAPLGMRMGLRCLATLAPAIHAAVFPNGMYLPAGRKMHFIMGPFPYGTLKKSIAEALQVMKWTARPLQPVASAKVVQGVMWKIQATTSPPSSVITSDCGELVIMKLGDPDPVAPPQPSVVASSQTLQLCSHSREPRADPLQINDPWAGHGRRASSSQATPCPIHALEQKVVDAVMARMPVPAMEIDKDDGMEARVQLLERQVNELHEGQCRFQSASAEQAKQHGLQIQQLQQQGQRLETVVAENVSQLGSFQSQFQRQLDKRQSSLDFMFQQQMDKIEDLFSKRARKE